MLYYARLDTRISIEDGLYLKQVLIQGSQGSGRQCIHDTDDIDMVQTCALGEITDHGREFDVANNKDRSYVQMTVVNYLLVIEKGGGR